MVDLAEDDKRGTFHFVTGDEYLPVPKEACTPDEVLVLKRIVADAQAGVYLTSEAIHDSVIQSGAPIDESARQLYLGDRALLPAGCGSILKGKPLLEILHAEHFARLCAEYGASIIRDTERPPAQQQAIQKCRLKAKHMLIEAWQQHIQDVSIDLEAYASAAVAPLLPESSSEYSKMKRLATVPRPLGMPSDMTLKTRSERDERRRWGTGSGRENKSQMHCLSLGRMQAVQEVTKVEAIKLPEASEKLFPMVRGLPDDDVASTVAPSTAMTDDGSPTESDDAEDFQDWEDPGQ
jgi:hypothetical protein